MSPARQPKGSPAIGRIARQFQIDPTLQTGRNAIIPSLAVEKKRAFDPHTFLATIGEGRKSVLFQGKQGIFAQGDVADAVFFIQTGKVKLTVVSKTGREATIAILGDRDFFGEGSLAGQAIRMGSATAMTDCAILRIDKEAMMEALHREHGFSDLFVAYLLARNIDRLRRKRNTALYDDTGFVSHHDAEQSLESAGDYLNVVRVDIAARKP
jgi:CRP-like cAMP-binding protein